MGLAFSKRSKPRVQGSARDLLPPDPALLSLARKARQQDRSKSKAAASPARASDILLTHAAHKIEPGSACRAKPQRGAASEKSPARRRFFPRYRGCVASSAVLRRLWRKPTARKPCKSELWRWVEGIRSYSSCQRQPRTLF